MCTSLVPAQATAGVSTSSTPRSAKNSRISASSRARSRCRTDGHALVVTVGNDDYETMIRLFFAMKVWVLKEKVVLPD